jgi:hypothetical protein
MEIHRNIKLADRHGEIMPQSPIESNEDARTPMTRRRDSTEGRIDAEAQ